MGLEAKKCVPCMGGIPPMGEIEAKKLLAKIDHWKLIESAGKIKKSFKFKDFVQAMEFVNKIAQIAETEGHHPDIFVSYNTVEITIFTHKINGLTESDFILAAKIDQLKGTQ